MHSASELKHRQVYRAEVHGLLPFETRGMDDPVPTIDFSLSENLDASYALERRDVDGDNIPCVNLLNIDICYRIFLYFR